MRHTKSYLHECEQLHQAGLPCVFDVGRCIARGYADLGYEEFLLLTEQKLLSLLSGKVSELPEEHKKFFFLVLSADQLVNEIVSRGYDLAPLVFESHRTWLVSVTNSDQGRKHVARGDSLDVALLRVLMMMVVVRS